MTPPRTVAVLGAGFSGTLAAIHLLRAGSPRLRLILVEPSGRVGPGLAYGRAEPWHLLNVPAGNMSAFPDAPDDFLAFARGERPDAGPGDFLPRPLYGRYLEALWGKALSSAPPDAPAPTVLPLAAMSLQARPDGLDLRLADGTVHRVDAAILALGNSWPSRALPGLDRLAGDPRVLGDIWSGSALHGIPPAARVLIIGTGLSMVDGVLTLVRRGHRGPITAMSRSGRLPEVHSPGPKQPPFLPTPPPASARALLRAIRAELAAAAGRGIGWRQVLDALRPQTQAAWAGLPLPERRRFLRHVRALWEPRRHRMAPAVGAELAALSAEGRLRVLAGRIQGAEAGPAGVRVALRRRGSVEIEHLEADRVLNCSGPDLDFRRVESPLISSLMAQGLALADPLGFGLMTGPGYGLVDSRGVESDRLFGIGSLLKGKYYESTAVPELRVQARDLASRILAG